MKTEIDKIYDEDNSENIFLYGEDGEKHEFEQIAVLPMKEKVYVILKPVGMDILADDEALVFYIDDFDGEESLVLVDDDEVIDSVFDGYYDLLREEGIDVD